MQPDDGLSSTFDAERPRLRRLAFRMLGSLDEADDAVQQAWLRAERADRHAVENLPGWLTTVTSRTCLDLLRTRRRRAESPLETVRAGGPSEPPTADRRSERADADPEAAAVMAEEVGLALLVVLDRLSPAQRVAFVLHDLFAVPFDEIAPVVDRSAVATKKLASRARARVHGVPPVAGPVPAPAEHTAVVEAFLAASRDGDLRTLMDVLAPDVVRRADRSAVPPGTPAVVRGARAVADETKAFTARVRAADVALVDGVPGIVVAPAGRLVAVLRVTIAAGRITEVDVVGDPARLAATSLAILPPARG